MIDLVDLILDSRLPIIWALRFANHWDRSISATDIARTLVLQAMQAGADRLLNSAFPVTVELLREAASLDEWIAILNHLLSDIRICIHRFGCWPTRPRDNVRTK